MAARRPLVIVMAGPNGAGKSTTAPSLLRDALQVSEFVNADAIAGGLSAFRPDSVAIPAGRAMVERMQQLAKARADFAFETTLASRSFAPWLARLKHDGYHVHVLFLWLENADLAVESRGFPGATRRSRCPRKDRSPTIREGAAEPLRPLSAARRLLADLRQLACGAATAGRLGARRTGGTSRQPIDLEEDDGGVS